MAKSDKNKKVCPACRKRVLPKNLVTCNRCNKNKGCIGCFREATSDTYWCPDCHERAIKHLEEMYKGTHLPHRTKPSFLDWNWKPNDGGHMNLPTPTNDRIIVKPEKGPEISKGGIHIPDTAQKKTLKGTVLAVGPGERANVPCSPVNKSPHLTVDEFEHLQKITMDVRIPMFLKVGDIVYYAEYTGNEIEVDGQKLLVFPECDILAFDRP